MPLFTLKKFKGLFSPRASPLQVNSPANDSRSDSQSSTNRDRSQSTSETKASTHKHRNSTLCSSSTPKIVISVPPSPLLTSSSSRKGILLKNSFKVQSETCLREAVNPNANSRNKSTQNTPALPDVQTKKRVTFAKDVRQSANEQYINLKFVEKFHEKTGGDSLPTLKAKPGFSSPQQICMQFCPNDGFLPMSFTPKAQLANKKSELNIDFLREDLLTKEPISAAQHNKTPKYQIMRQMETRQRQNSISMLPIIGSPCSMKAGSSSNEFTFGALTSLTPKHSDNSRGSFSRRSLFESNSPSQRERDFQKNSRARASIGPIEINNIQAMRAADQKLESEFLDDQSEARNHAHLLIRKQRGSLLVSSN